MCGNQAAYRVITLTTDFGLTDPFVGIMKGVILGICPGARVLDPVFKERMFAPVAV